MSKAKTDAVLHLNLQRQFFDEIALGLKRTEYRASTAYWKTRLEGRQYNVIQFRNGYATKAPKMRVEFLGYRRVKKWGRTWYAIRLGRVLQIKGWKRKPVDG